MGVCPFHAHIEYIGLQPNMPKELYSFAIFQKLGFLHVLGAQVHVKKYLAGIISLFPRINTRVISLAFPGACIYVHYNPLGDLLCLHVKNRLSEMRSISNPSTYMCVRGPMLHKNVGILWS